MPFQLAVIVKLFAKSHFQFLFLQEIAGVKVSSWLWAIRCFFGWQWNFMMASVLLVHWGFSLQRNHFKKVQMPSAKNNLCNSISSWSKQLIWKALMNKILTECLVNCLSALPSSTVSSEKADPLGTTHWDFFGSFLNFRCDFGRKKMSDCVLWVSDVRELALLDGSMHVAFFPGKHFEKFVAHCSPAALCWGSQNCDVFQSRCLRSRQMKSHRDETQRERERERERERGERDDFVRCMFKWLSKRWEEHDWRKNGVDLFCEQYLSLKTLGLKMILQRDVMPVHHR